MPAVQNWGPTPPEQYLTYDGGAFVAPAVNVPFVIKDIIGTTLANGASDIRFRGFTHYDNPTVQWVNPSSYNTKPYQNYNDVIPYTNGMSYNFLPTFQNLSSLPPGNYIFYHTFYIDILNTAGIWENVAEYTYSLRLEVAGVVTPPTPTFSFSPATLAYAHKQNEVLQSLGVLLTGNLWKIIGKPNFILSTATAGVTIATTGTGAAAYQTISGSGNAIINCALSSFYDSEVIFATTDLAGTFEILENNIHFGNVNWTVAVTRISDFLTTPYLSTQKAFTLDQKYFEFNSTKSGTYFQFDAVIRTYDFFTNVLNEYTIPEKVVLFKGKAKVNLGQLIHRLMRKFDTVNETLLQYKLATLSVSCSEILALDDSIIRSGTSATISFVAGLSRSITNLGFLDFNPLPNRGTKTGFSILNILYPAGNYELKTFKNGTLVSSVALPASTNTIVCKKVSFSAFAKGDVIQYIVDVVGQTNALAPKKTFKLFPEGNYSNTIVWQNEFLLQSALECTGTASIKSDFEFISQKVYENLVEKLEHLSAAKEVKLYINTGWLLKTDVDTIESLMRSKRAWLLNTKGNIAIRPIGKTMVNQDLQRELIEFSLEFTINRNYDEETYSL